MNYADDKLKNLKIDDIIIVDHQKPNSYTDRKRFSVRVNNEYILSGETEIIALKRAICWIFKYMQSNTEKLQKLEQALGPVINLIRPEDDD